MSGAAAISALLLLQASVGSIGAAAWTQSWSVVRRGHFRIVAWSALACAAGAVVATGVARAQASGSSLAARPLVVATAVGAALYLLVQYSRTDLLGTVVGTATCLVGTAALGAAATLVGGWPAALAATQLLAGAALLGAVVNGMLLGHWYLNQPGLQPSALGRLTTLALVATALAAALGAAGSRLLAGASTEGAVLGLPGFGSSFGGIFFAVWAALVAFTGAVVWAARRCIAIRAIQSATGLYYVAVLSGGASEFLVLYLMLNAS
jgi:hypothetical protein